MTKAKKIGIGITVGGIILSISAQESQIPAWVKGVANFWVEGNISDDEFGEAVTFLIEQKIIRVAMPNVADDTELKNKISQLEAEKTRLENEILVYKRQNLKLQNELNNIQDSDYTVDDEKVLNLNFSLERSNNKYYLV